jgi:hypothetical protein
MTSVESVTYTRNISLRVCGAGLLMVDGNALVTMACVAFDVDVTSDTTRYTIKLGKFGVAMRVTLPQQLSDVHACNEAIVTFANLTASQQLDLVCEEHSKAVFDAKCVFSRVAVTAGNASFVDFSMMSCQRVKIFAFDNAKVQNAFCALNGMVTAKHASVVSLYNSSIAHVSVSQEDTSSVTRVTQP